MANPPPRDSAQQARKSARGKRPTASLAIINLALSEAPLPKKRRTDGGESNVQKADTPTVSETITLPRKVERPPTRPPPLSASISSVKLSPDTTPSSGANNGGVSDSCFRTIAELFVMRYIRTFDNDRLGLESAYASEAILSCRFVSASHAPAPYHFAKCNTGIVQGSSNIVQTLSSFSQEIVFIPAPGSPLDVTIDILRLSDANYFATLMFNTIIKGVEASVDMIFLLKDSARLTGRENRLRMLWSPFVVVSHQIILRA